MSPLYHCRCRRQRQRLSLKYALRSASCTHLRKLLPFSAPKMMQKSCKIVTEIDPESMQNRPPKGQNDSQIEPWAPQTTQEGPRRVAQSLLGRSWGSMGHSWRVLGRLLGSPGAPPGSKKVLTESPQPPQRPQNRSQNVSQDRIGGQPGSETTFDMIFA